ncbi:MAG: hypothetical protein GDA36_08005 [Rhodobacteraceae bacterium]|nr:hypothetical protein [Paracoccaceae bacterium]
MFGGSFDWAIRLPDRFCPVTASTSRVFPNYPAVLRATPQAAFGFQPALARGR